MPTISYQNLLLSNVFRSRRISIFNSFSNPSLIKKRIIMMTKKRTSSLANFKILLVLPVTVLLLVFISSCKISSKSSAAKIEVASVPPSEVFVVVEEMPQFPGGEKALFDFIYANLQYPENAKKNKTQGRVILRFCVNYLGGTEQVSLLKGVDPELDKEAIRIIKLLPKWQPGKQGGFPVNVWYSLPVTFQLN
jgi:TonB family protein